MPRTHARTESASRLWRVHGVPAHPLHRVHQRLERVRLGLRYLGEHLPVELDVLVLQPADELAVSDAVLIGYPGSIVRKVARGNGRLLALLNQNLSLRRDKIKQSKWQLKPKKDAKKKSKTSVKETIQTFFSDLFPDSNSPKTEPS